MTRATINNGGKGGGASVVPASASAPSAPPAPPMLTAPSYNDGEYDDEYNDNGDEFDDNVFPDNDNPYCQRCRARCPASLVNASFSLPEPARAEVPCGTPLTGTGGVEI